MLMSPEKIRSIVRGRGNAAAWQMDIYKDLVSAVGKELVIWLRRRAADAGPLSRDYIALHEAADVLEKEV